VSFLKCFFNKILPLLTTISNTVYLLLDHTCRQLENGRSAALERIRMLEERHQQELEKGRAAAAERTRIMLEERHHQE
jgi:hypothetical protein